MGSHALWHVPEVPTGTPEWVKVSTMPVIVNDWTCWEWQFDGQNGTAAEAADPRIWINGVEQTWGDTFVYPDRAAHPTQEKAGNFTTLEAGVRPVAAHPARVQVRVRVGPGVAGGSSAGAGGASGAAGGSGGAAGSGGAVGSSGAGGGTGLGCTAPGTICWDFEEGTSPTGWTAMWGRAWVCSG